MGSLFTLVIMKGLLQSMESLEERLDHRRSMTTSELKYCAYSLSIKIRLHRTIFIEEPSALDIQVPCSHIRPVVSASESKFTSSIARVLLL